MFTGVGRAGSFVWLIAALQMGCASVPCPRQAAMLISIDHVEASDAPTGTTRAVYEDGTAEWIDEWRRSRCVRLNPEQFERLRKITATQTFLSEPGFEGFTSHREMIQIHQEGRTRVYLARNVPPVLIEFLDVVDSVFSGAFGESYQGVLPR